MNDLSFWVVVVALVGGWILGYLTAHWESGL